MPTIYLNTGDTRDYLFYRKGGGGTVEIHDIGVSSERRAGKGTKLLNRLYQSLPKGTKVWALTRYSNGIAQQFYEANGFKILGILPGFYPPEKGDGDAIMYGRESP